MYFKVQSLIEFDTFVSTHGPFTNIDGKCLLYFVFHIVLRIFLSSITGSCDYDHTEVNTLKRKGGSKLEPLARRSKQPAYFIPELAHVVALCDERLPFVTLANEVCSLFILNEVRKCPFLLF